MKKNLALLNGSTSVMTLFAAQIAMSQSCLYLDDFDDGESVDEWAEFTIDSSRLDGQEQNGHVEFTAPVDNPGYTLLAGQISEGWQVDMTSDWALSARYHIFPPSPSYGDVGVSFIVAFEFDLAQPTLFTGYTLSGGTENLGSFDSPYEVTRFWQDGATEIMSNLTRQTSDSTIYIWYEASTGCISHGLTPGTPIATICGVNGLSSRTTAHLGIAGYNLGFVPAWTGEQLWIDEFCVLNGTLVGPRVGGCCTDGVCRETLASACEGTWLGAGSFCNDTCLPCTADLNNNGNVDGADLNIMLGYWGLDTIIGDINEDGLVDGADLNILLGAWGPCP